MDNKITDFVPASLLAQAITQGIDLDKIKDLIQLKNETDSLQAKREYISAMADFKIDTPKIIKDLVNPLFNSRYSSLSNLVTPINKHLANFGFSARWDYRQTSDTITVTCILMHESGHQESATLTGPKNIAGSENPLHQIKSTTTYLRGATFEAVTGIALTDQRDDDDGNNANIKHINKDQLNRVIALLNKTNTDENKLLNYLNVNSLEEIPETSFNTAIGLLDKKLAGKNK